MTGTVNINGEPLLRLFLRGTGSILHEVEAVLDTGFNGFLCLEQSLIDSLLLTYERQERTMLANGIIEECAVYSGVVVWDNQERTILIQSAEGGALIGTALLDGYELCIEVQVGGHVRIQQLPTPTP